MKTLENHKNNFKTQKIDNNAGQSIEIISILITIYRHLVDFILQIFRKSQNIFN